MSSETFNPRTGALRRLERLRSPRRLRHVAYEILRGYPPVDVLVERGLQLGKGVKINRGVIIDPAHCHLISIDDRTLFGPEVLVLAHDASTKRQIDYTRVARVHIGKRVFVGARAIILPGVTIGDDAVIGAGSVVTRDVAPGTVVAGNPARQIKTTADYVEPHEALIGKHPTYDREWTRRAGMSVERARQMAEDLAGTSGYVK